MPILTRSKLIGSPLIRAHAVAKAAGAAPFTTEWKFAGVGDNDSSVGDERWDNASNITASDNNHADADLNNSVLTTEILRADEFGFTTADIPEGATILGIEVGIERFNNAAGSGDCVDLLVRLRTGSGQVGDDKADTGTNWPGSDTEAVYGGASDDWNAGLTDSDVRSSGFGVDLRAEFSGGLAAGARVDAIRVRVHGEA